MRVVARVAKYVYHPIRTAFLLDSLKDLDEQLRAKRSRLFVVRGKPEEVLPGLLDEWSVTKLTFEADSEPRSLQRDKVREMAEASGIQVAVEGTSTMRKLDRYRKLMGKKQGENIKSYAAFIKLHENAGPVPPYAPDISGDLPPPGVSPDGASYDRFAIPSLDELGVEQPVQALRFKGGEREALLRLESVMEREVWISKFEKPKTSHNSIDPSTTVLSVYLTHGCLSARRFWHALCEVYDKRGGSKPPVSLPGQMLWREFNYFSGYTIPNFGKMVGNPVVRQIPWDKNEEKLTGWKEGRTGFPFIDAIMTQLKQEGWIHHLARHAVACFLTRGDLWQSWEDGAAVFDGLLLDANWSVHNFNWQWLSCSAFFDQYFRCYSPVAIGKKTDKGGDCIRKYVPVLRHFPSKCIYEPWNAPLEVQRGCHCIIGKDYPKPIVDHTEVSKDNMGKMHDAYAANKRADASSAAAGRGGNNGGDGGRGSSSSAGGKSRGGGGGGGGGGSGGGGSSGGKGPLNKRSKR